MNASLPPEINEIMEAVHYRPAVSIIMPFEPKMGLKKELVNSLKIAADKVEGELRENYSREVVTLVMQKLRTMIRDLNFNTHKKSIAVYVSPVFEKVLYLDVNVEEKIIIDESFEIRDLVYSKKQMHKYLVLLLSGKVSRIYLANTETFVRIVSDTPESVYAYVNETPERVANFSDVSERKEIVVDKFLRHIDNSLDIILNAYRLPLFIIGPEKILGHFKKLSKHTGAVIEYIQGNYDEATLPELRNLLKPRIEDWKMVLQKDLLNQLDDAAGKKKLCTGIKEVWHEAINHKGRLLVVEKDFMYAAQHGSSADTIYKATEPYNKFSYIRDVVDDIIEKVLENGGDVEFVDKDVLKEYQRIALIKYY
ncbi:MAG: baeRF3 domain-containing protein [Chitinophagaceae bacterium]